jgi:transposase
MKLKEKQWEFIQPVFNKYRVKNKLGRPPTDTRELLQGILWILKTGARWKDLPREYPSYQTCHRWFQKWVDIGLMDDILKALAQDLKDRGKLDLSECFIDGSFSGAKKGGLVLDLLSVEKGPRSWQLQTAMVFLSPYISTAPLHTKQNWLKGPLITDSSEEIHDDL